MSEIFQKKNRTRYLGHILRATLKDPIIRGKFPVRLT